MTKEQYKTLEFINLYIADKGYSPSIREIMKGLGIKSTSQVQGTIGRLVKIGKIKKFDNMHRGIEVINEQ